ncbi:MAG: nitroreductase family protein [Acidimicrobiia bacterium]|nr:nitroreductase family protein [Acidimicrobiia bacterium]
MEFADVIAGRRMVRAYRPDPISDESRERILTSGSATPTAGNSRGISLVAVTDRQRRAEIAVAAGEDDFHARGFPRWLSMAPLHIIPCVSPQAYRDRYSEPDKSQTESDAWDVPYWWVDGGAALMAILLAAVDEGLGAGFLGEHAIPGLRRVLEIPDGTQAIGVITVGHPDPERDRQPGSLERGRSSPEIHRDRWTTTPELGRR